MLDMAMIFPNPQRFLVLLLACSLPAAALRAEPVGVVSSKRTEGTRVTKLADPGHFIFENGVREEHFDGSKETMEALGGPGVAEPIIGLHYIQEHYVVNGSGWSPEDAKLLAAQFHEGKTRDFYFFRTAEGQLFYLPKEGDIAVIRIDYILKNGRTATTWTRK